MCKGTEIWISLMPKPSDNTLHKRTHAVGDQDGHLAASGSRQESVSGRRHRRVFTAAEKRRILHAADEALASGKRGALGAVLRKEGVYSSLLSSWRVQQGASGLAARKPGRKPQRTEGEQRMAVLTRRNEVLERQLHIAAALIELQKKAYAILEIALPKIDAAN